MELRKAVQQFSRERGAMPERIVASVAQQAAIENEAITVTGPILRMPYNGESLPDYPRTFGGIPLVADLDVPMDEVRIEGRGEPMRVRNLAVPQGFDA